MTDPRKIVLVGINARFSHSNLAIRYLRAMARTSSYQTAVLEHSINELPARIVDSIMDEAPVAAAFSVYIWNAQVVRESLMLLNKRAPDLPVILGGPEAGYRPDDWLDCSPGRTYIVTGAGEAGFARLLDRDLAVDPGIITVPPLPFSEVPFPYADGDFDALRNRYVYYESSRGCPFSCSYCLSSREDQRLQLRDTDTVLRELDIIIAHAPRYVKFVDRSFNVHREHARAVWRHLIDRKERLRTTFHFEVFPDLLGDDDLRILAGAPPGLMQFEIGVQTVHRPTLAAIGRKSSWEKARPALAALARLGTVPLHLDLLAGLPGEDAGLFAASFNEVYALHPDHCQIELLKVLPGTAMREQAAGLGIAYAADPPYRVTATPRLDRGELDRIEGVARIMDALYNRGSFPTLLAGLVSLFSDPFSFYADFSALCGQDLPTDKNSERYAALLLEYIDKRFPARGPYLRDCLRWDWCVNAGSHRYPPRLRPAGDTETKKSALRLINAIAKKASPCDHDTTVQSGDLRRAIWFAPETEEFRTARLRDARFAAVLKPSQRIVFITEEDYYSIP